MDNRYHFEVTIDVNEDVDVNEAKNLLDEALVGAHGLDVVFIMGHNPDIGDIKAEESSKAIKPLSENFEVKGNLDLGDTKML